jgi:hypothetical protein
MGMAYIPNVVSRKGHVRRLGSLDNRDIGLHVDMAQGLPLGTEGKFAGLFNRSRLRLAISALRSLSSRI